MHIQQKTEIGDLIEKLNYEVSPMACLGGIMYKDIEVWFVDSGYSCHMIRLRSMFSRFT